MALIVIIGYVVALLAVLAWATTRSGAADALPSASSQPQASAVSRIGGVSAPVHYFRRCLYARIGLSWYRARFVHWTIKRGASISGWRHARNCADARYLANLWAGRSFESRRATERWIERRTLNDFEVRPGNRAWHRAVHEAQKVYPGTESWLLSCSASEGGHGRWVIYGGGSWYPGYTRVGGWLQMYLSTWERMFSAARAEVDARGYRLPASARSWFSPLGQALAGAWGSIHSRHEWAGYGCR